MDHSGLIISNDGLRLPFLDSKFSSRIPVEQPHIINYHSKKKKEKKTENRTSKRTFLTSGEFTCNLYFL